MKKFIIKIFTMHDEVTSMQNQLLVETDSAKKEWLASQITTIIDSIKSELQNSPWVQLETFLHSKIKPDFNFEVEHWDNGNFDDSYEYGVSVGEQYAFEEVQIFIKNLDN